MVYGGSDAFPSDSSEKALTAKFENIGDHELLTIRFNFYFFDSWDDEVLTVLVDGVEVKRQVHHVHMTKNTAICGVPGWKDWIEGQVIQVPHSSPTAEIKIRWRVDQPPNDESGGLREIQIVAYKSQIYSLNGKSTNSCPFYAPLNQETMTCVDSYFNSLESKIKNNKSLFFFVSKEELF